MFIELTEILRCPRPHDESYLICGPVTMDGRDVIRGGLACAACHAEFPIIDRVAWFAPPGEPPGSAAPSALTAEAAVTFLDLQGGGGYVVTVGSAGWLAGALAGLLPNISLAAVNPPEGVAATGTFSLLRSPGVLPVKRHSVRGVIVGADAAQDPWLSASVGTVLTGLRVIVESEQAKPEGVVELVRGAGVFVGERRAR